MEAMRMVNQDPEDIRDGAHELVLDRVCAIDVAKASGKVCVRFPRSASARRVSKVWDVCAHDGAVSEFGDHLVGAGIEKVTLESTSPPPICGGARGLDVQLVNAGHVRNVPGPPKTAC